MNRSLMPKRFEPMLTVGDMTEDGAAEVYLSVNGHDIASTVVLNRDDVHFVLQTWIRQELLRRC